MTISPTPTLSNSLVILVKLRLLTGLRTVGDLIRNPFLVVVTGAGFGVLFAAQNAGRSETVTAWTPHLSGAVTAAAIALLALITASAQRGSPIRWQPFDVVWIVTSHNGPRILLIEQIFGSTLRAIPVSAVGATISLTLQDRPSYLGLVTALAVGSVTLWIRLVSLCAHLIGLIRPAMPKAAMIGAAVTLAVTTTVIIAENVAHLQIFPRNTPIQQFFYGFVAPEKAEPVFFLSALVLGCVIGTVVVLGSERFVAEAVAASIESEQLRQALSGRAKGGLDLGSGLRTGIRSWNTWPTRPDALLIVAAWVHHRRALRYRVAIDAVCWLTTAALTWLAPPGWAFVAVAATLLLAAAAAPVGPEAQLLASPTVWLSGISATRIALSTTAAASISISATAMPAALIAMWGEHVLLTVSVAVVAYVPIAATLMSTAALASSALIENPLVRIATTTAAGVIPASVGISSCALYGTMDDGTSVFLALTAPTALLAALMFVVLCSIAATSPYQRV